MCMSRCNEVISLKKFAEHRRLPHVGALIVVSCCVGCTPSKLFDLAATCFAKAHSSAQQVLQMAPSASVADDVVGLPVCLHAPLCGGSLTDSRY